MTAAQAKSNSLLIGLLCALIPPAATWFSAHVRYSPGLLFYTDYIAIPGAFLTRIVYPASLITGRASNLYFALEILVNLLFYWFLAYLILRTMAENSRPRVRQ